MFWSRSLLPLEHEFVLRHFGHSLQSLQPRIRLYLRRLGDTRRALSMNGGRIYLPRSFFEAGQPERVLKLDHPAVAGVFAHELLHQWQRLQGVGHHGVGAPRLRGGARPRGRVRQAARP